MIRTDGDNERQSAKMFLEFAEEAGGLSAEDVRLVEQMILATITHSVPDEYQESQDLKVDSSLPFSPSCDVFFFLESLPSFPSSAFCLTSRRRVMSRA